MTCCTFRLNYLCYNWHWILLHSSMHHGLYPPPTLWINSLFVVASGATSTHRYVKHYTLLVLPIQTYLQMLVSSPFCISLPYLCSHLLATPSFHMLSQSCHQLLEFVSQVCHQSHVIHKIAIDSPPRHPHHSQWVCLIQVSYHPTHSD